MSPTMLAQEVTGGRYLRPPHIRLIEEKLLDIYHGKIRRLIITLGPRHGKSELISKYFPAWYLGKRPDDKILLTCYGASFAASWGRKVRDIIDGYGHNFDISLDEASRAVNKFNIKGFDGGLNTAGVDGDVYGKGANIFIVDDPVKNDKEANSITYRDNIWNWYRSTATSRLEPNGAIIIIMTR